MKNEDQARWYMIGFGTLFCVAGFAVILFGKHHVDEGYYHLIAHLTAKGKLPYQDYFYVQTPVYPIVYGFLFRFLGSSLLMARGYSLVFSLINFFIAVRIAAKLRGTPGAVAAATLILCQPFTLYYLGIIKLYALAGLLVTIIVYVLTLKTESVWKYSSAAGIAALAICTRLTLFPALPMVIGFALLRTRGKKRVVTLSIALITAFIVFAGLLLPFFVISPETFGYSIIGYHLDKEGFSTLRQMFHKFDVFSRVCRLYLPLLLICFVAFFSRFNGLKSITNYFRKTDTDGADDSLLLLTAIVIFHFTSQAPYVHRYLAMLIPAAAALLGPELVRLADAFSYEKILHRKGVIWCMICFIAYVGLGQWELAFSGPNPVAQLKSISNEIAMLTAPGDEILTFNNSIAVEADRPVMPGDEMNVLTYHPDWTKERCRKFGVLNVDMLEQALEENRLRAVLITKYSFIGNFPTFFNPGETGARPRIIAALEKHYHRIGTFPGFGYMGETQNCIFQ
ncbi:hypothetical protein K8T06_05055 [bacterium]|nr:hypothetical protein [bacterium]